MVPSGQCSSSVGSRVPEYLLRGAHVLRTKTRGWRRKPSRRRSERRREAQPVAARAKLTMPQPRWSSNRPVAAEPSRDWRHPVCLRYSGHSLVIALIPCGHSKHWSRNVAPFDMRRRCAYFRHHAFAHINNGHHKRISSVGRLYDVDSRRGAAVKARTREQHLVVQTVKSGRDLMTSRRIFLVERQIREKPLFRYDVHNETHLARLLE